MIPSSVKKKFIAGAICPKCQLLDKIAVYTIANKQFAECVRCGHRQEANFTDSSEQQPTQGKKQKIIWLKHS